MSKKTGAVMVLGSGIGGIQASLDLAEQGFKVYLVDKRPSIGGVMAQLDKTFPTNDCAMCLLSPKLVDAGRHPNIELITYAELIGVTGEAGNFKVNVRKRSRYVDPDKCTGCGECADACPVAVPSEFDWRIGDRKAIYRLYPQAIPNTFTIDKRGIPPCRNSCPTGVNIQGFVALIRQKKFAEALALYKERNPFPGTCGRICHHPCEDVCNRGKLDEPIASISLHRFLFDLEMKGHSLLNNDCPEPMEEKAAAKLTKEKSAPVKKNRGAKVAIVGSGPTGLTAAYDLAKMGYQPTVFEALPVAGGMLRVGIPRYRLPEEVLDYEIEAIKKEGVEIKTNTPVGPDLTLNDLFKAGYESILIAIGTHKSRELNIEGEDLEGVIHGVGFLRNVKIGKKERLDGKVVAVIGGGNVAIDSVRTALRLGAKKAFIIYRRSKEEMPAFEDELKASEQEGIEIYYLAAPKRILGKNGKVVGIECIRMELGKPDETGRRQPIPIKGSEFTIDVDIVIPAISQLPDLSLLTEVTGLKVTKEGVLPVEGVDLDGVRGFTDFLRDASLGREVKIGPRVTVIGGGNVAIDVARTSLRLGSKEVHLVCLEKKEEMPAFKSEIKEAEKESVVIHNSLAPKRILGKDGKAIGVEYVKCISVFDSEGKFNPKFKEGTESVIASETVIVAIGQVVDYTLLKAADGVLVTKAGIIQVDDVTFATNVRSIFAAGDVIGGPGLAVDGIAQGHEVAISIDRFLRSEDLKEGRIKKEVIKIAEIPEYEVESKPRQAMPTLPVDKRVRSFDEVELGFTEEQALEEANRCLNCSICAECLQCVEACEPEAIDHQMQDEIIELDVGAIILGPGYDRFNPRLKPEYNYTHSKNIVTSPEFERILSASGPFQGHLVRPSDHKEPKRLAFLQCVGSRDETCNPYCSSVCCMYATKEAIVAKEHAGQDLETDIYFMDMRAHGKGFDRYYERAKAEYKVNYRRCRLPRVEEVQDGSGDLTVKYLSEEGRLKEERYDLVVLSTGLVSPEDVKDLSCKLGIDLNEFNFAQVNGFFRESTSRDGIYVCGAIVEPKDIPETVIQASAAASSASALLAESRGSLVKEKVYPEEKDVSEESPRLGVFICHCGINIAGIVDVEEVADYAKTLPNVNYVEHNLYTCSQDTQQKIKGVIEEHKLNRIVIASCTPRTHEPLFQDTIREAGLNPFLLEFVSIREQCSWVHSFEKEKATEKSKELVAMAVAKARLLEPLHRSSFSVNKKGLVIGAGISGMSAALSLAEQGFEVYLIEKEDELGGNLRNLYFTLGGDDPQELLRRTIDEVERNKKIHVYKGAQIREFSGYIGNFRTKIITSNQRSEQSERSPERAKRVEGKEEIEIEHGVVIVATGAKERDTTEYLRGKNECVITQKELEKKLSQKETEHEIKVMKSVVMIQCVGSREDDAPYCSRICCSNAIKNALKLKELNPRLDIYILYRDIRTYGFRELFYEEARDKGIIFIRFEKETKPQVKEIPGADSQLLVEADEPILRQKIRLNPELLVLSTGIAPYDENKDLSQLLKVPLNEDGFFLEAHIKLRPVDFSTDGIYLCGIAHSPKSVDEAISQGRAAASRAVTLLSKDSISATSRTVKVNERLCVGCGLCVTICPYQARELDKLTGKAKVTEVLCQGCGACVVACPSGASQQFGFTKKELLEAVDALSKK